MTTFVTEDEFAAFLKNLPLDQRFDQGYGSVPWSQACPLATYLKAHVGTTHWYRSNDVKDPGFLMPDWAQKFVERFDRLPVRERTVACAILVLEEVCLTSS